MKILKVKFKNFCSYGNVFQEIEFHKDQSELYLITGSNGAGKSSIANAIKFMLYGKVDGMSNGDLPNRINKELYGEIEIESKGKLIKIERGLAPSVFKVIIDGKEFDKAGKLSTQEYLEEEIFEIPYHVFKNVIILSVNDFKSFLTMSPADKKNIVDRIFGFSVINEMRESIKKQRKELKLQIRSIDDTLTTMSDSIGSVYAKMTILEKKKLEKNEEKIKSLKAELIALNEDRKKLTVAKEKIDAMLTVAEEDLQKNNKLLNLNSSEIASLDDKLSLYESNKCPTCTSDLTTDFHQQVKTDLEEKRNDTASETITIKESVADTKQKIKDVKLKQTAVLQKVATMGANIKNLKDQLVEIAKSGEEGEYQELSSLVEDFRIKEQEKTAEKSTVEADDYYLNLLEGVLGEDGIKNLAMKTILPALNGQVASMSEKMNIHFNIKFDDKFDSHIMHLGESISPKTLSTGERKKADFVIIISLIKLLKLRFPGLNILFLDEIFSSVDANGVYHIVEILSEVIKEVELNTFVINHTVLPSELFDKKLEIKKDTGFSEFEIETIE